MSKKIVILIAMGMIMAAISGCAVVDESTRDVNNNAESTNEAEENTEPTSEYDAENSIASKTLDEESVQSAKYQVGDTVAFETTSGAQIEVTITDWGYDSNVYTDERLLYVEYEIKNVGNISVTVSNALFNIYADDYVVQQSFSASSDMAVASAELSGGRKVAGRVYGDINPDSVGTIDLEVGDAVFAIKDGNTSTNDSVEASDVEISSDMVREDFREIDPLEIAGEYVGLESDSIMKLNIYSSPEGNEVGNFEAHLVSFSGETVDLSGLIIRLDMNIYGMQTENGCNYIFGVSEQNVIGILLDIYCSDNQIAQLAMTQHYES